MRMNKKTITITAIGLLTLGIAGSCIGISHAGFARSRFIQDANSSEINPSGSGRRTKTWYCKINTWHTYDGVSPSDYWVLGWVNASRASFGSSIDAVVYDFEWTQGNLEDSTTHKYSFAIDIRYDYIQFFRMKPSYTPTTFLDRNYNGGATTYNYTEELTIASAGDKTIYEVGTKNDGDHPNTGSWVSS